MILPFPAFLRFLTLAISVATVQAIDLSVSSNGTVVLGHINPNVGNNQRGTVLACDSTYYVPDNGTIITCKNVSAETHVPVTDIQLLNSGISCDSITSIPPNTYLCLDNPAPVTSGSVSCLYTYVPQSDDTCGPIQEAFNLDTTTFTFLNPTVNCRSLPLSGPICVEGTLSTNPKLLVGGNPTESSFSVTPASGCSNFATVRSPTACLDISAANHISISSLVSLNADLNCWGLRQNNTLCIDVDSSVPVTTVAPSISITTQSELSTSQTILASSSRFASFSSSFMRTENFTTTQSITAAPLRSTSPPSDKTNSPTTEKTSPPQQIPEATAPPTEKPLQPPQTTTPAPETTTPAPQTTTPSPETNAPAVESTTPPPPPPPPTTQAPAILASPEDTPAPGTPSPVPVQEITTPPPAPAPAPEQATPAPAPAPQANTPPPPAPNEQQTVTPEGAVNAIDTVITVPGQGSNFAVSWNWFVGSTTDCDASITAAEFNAGFYAGGENIPADCGKTGTFIYNGNTVSVTYAWRTTGGPGYHELTAQAFAKLYGSSEQLTASTTLSEFKLAIQDPGRISAACSGVC